MILEGVPIDLGTDWGVSYKTEQMVLLTSPGLHGMETVVHPRTSSFFDFTVSVSKVSVRIEN